VTAIQTDAVDGGKTQTIKNMNITQLECMLSMLQCDLKKDTVQGESIYAERITHRPLFPSVSTTMTPIIRPAKKKNTRC
jgi:hypothetical protein